MEMDCQFISIYGKFVTSQTAHFSCANININGGKKITAEYIEVCIKQGFGKSGDYCTKISVYNIIGAN